MKTMKAICTATVLALVLSVSAFAGDIAAPGAPTPSTDVTSTGDLTVSTDPTMDVSATSSTYVDLFTENVLALISLF